MYIAKEKKYRQDGQGSIETYVYYKLAKNIRDVNGKPKKVSVLGLGELAGLSPEERDELADLLTSMIETGQTAMASSTSLYELALDFYARYRESKYARENDPILKAEYERKERERLKDMVMVNLSTLTQHEARTIGCENICNSTLNMLKIREYLRLKGWSKEDIGIALMQIIARSIYPYSELKTVRYLQENTALCEMFKVSRNKITKDVLYRNAIRLWEEHRGLEDWLHDRVCSIFDIEEKILLMDITNTYVEGQYENSCIFKFGRSKEKRNDCKVIVLAAVVNTDGLIVRTMIYEGNRHDSTTVEDVVSSISNTILSDAKKIVVMDAGFYSKDNVNWLVRNGYDYITVLPSAESRFEPASGRIVEHEDAKHQRIRLQHGSVCIDGETKNALLVDSDAKAAKERSMYEQACQRFEEGLKSISSGIRKKGGTKKRDAVNKRIGKLEGKYGAIRKNFTISMTYEGEGKNEVVASMNWTRNDMKADEIRKFHGKYVLLTSLDEKDEVNIWKFYNVIRVVEETFHTLKTDIDIRPIYHKTDLASKAHINLAVLAYWVVSVTKFRLKKKDGLNVRWDEIMRIASTQVVVTAKLKTNDGTTIKIRQSTEAEEKLMAIYDLLDISPYPIGKRKSVGPPERNLEKNGT